MEMKATRVAAIQFIFFIFYTFQDNPFQ